MQLACVGVPGGIDSGVFITADSGTPAGPDAGAQAPLDAGTTSVVDAGKTADAGRGARFDGGVISPRLAGLADNTGLDLGKFICTASTLDRVTTTGPTSDHQNPGYSYDSLNQIIGGGVENDHIFIFDPPTKTWTSHAINGGSPGTQAFLAIGYDPVNNVFVFVNDYASGQHTWAYRYKN